MTLNNVPVIDIAQLDSAATLAALDDACREWGFFQVTGHGVDHAVMEAVYQKSQEFFSLPTTTKRSISRTAENPWGFFDSELTKNTPDWKEIFDYGPAEIPEDGSPAMIYPQWPRSVPGFEKAILDYYAACETLSFALLGAIARNLDTAPGLLQQIFRPDHTSFVRLNYYPLCPRPERPEGLRAPVHGHLGINHHTDAGAITCLLQDSQAGLEVYKEGNWHLIDPVPGALTINIGDIVQVWSNGRYEAALHRVTASESHPRYSAPFFFNPAYSAHYAPLPSVVDVAHPARYRSINWGEFRSRRAAGDYADHGEEVQISHYAVQS